jgi:casein kinase I family protein HRR25
MDRRILQFGTQFGDYIITRCIGCGGYGDIYMVCDTQSDQAFAMKVEYVQPGKKTSLQDELQFLCAVQGSPFYPKLITFGQKNGIQYIVIELLGPNLSSLRKYMSDGKFKLGTFLKIALQTLIIIEDFHNNGFIHNDIKPANFLLRPNSKSFLALTDFGLCTVAKGDGKRIGFHGTKIYAGPNAHLNKELTTVDDLFGWFYTILEIYSGTLPWRGISDENEIFRKKQQIKNEESFKSLPVEFQNIYECILAAKPEEEFNFDYCFNEIMACFDKYQVEPNQKFEWEEIPDLDAIKLSAIPLTLRPGKYAIEPDHNGFGVNSDGQITLFCTHGAKPKMYHPVSTVCRI